jgi:hypothetical protein
MEIKINGEWIEVDSDEYYEYTVGKQTNQGYDD